MHVSDIWIYPIKGIGGQKVESAYATESGFKNDRRFMLIDSNNKFISQRTHPKLAILSAAINNDSIQILDKNDVTNSLTFSRKDINLESEILASVWKSKVKSFSFKEEINQWFSDYLSDEVKLVQQIHFANRSRSINFKPNKIGLSYADGYPYLVLSKASVNDLSEKMGESVDIRQFRANIVLDDCVAFTEDKLNKFKIGETDFRMVKPCKRCPVININQDTGESNQQVVKALSTYRKSQNSIIFGMNAANLEEGTINVGDQLFF